MTLDKDNEYTKMQLRRYNELAGRWGIESPDYVVGSFHAHNNHKDYELLFEGMEDLKSKIVLDFGCGPGRNLVKFADKFHQIDGADIADYNLEKAKEWLTYNKFDASLINLYQTDGISLNPIPSEKYAIIMSTITMQHIPIHEIRFNIFADMLRVLKSGGWITIQMGYGPTRPGAAGYFENRYDAPGTNGDCDVLIIDIENLKDDLIKIGFKNFSHTITSVGPGDIHDNWIFFRAQKP